MSTCFALIAHKPDKNTPVPIAAFSHRKAAITSREHFQANAEYELEVVEIQLFSMKALSVPENIPLYQVQQELAKVRGMFKEPLW